MAEEKYSTSTKDQAAEARQALMLHALTAIRKALLETAKITLGNTCYLCLEVFDREGWPCMELKLIDRLAAAQVQLTLHVTAHDRQEMGMLQLSMNAERIIGELRLRNPDEFSRLPLVLKQGIREFLDLAYEYQPTPEAPVKARTSVRPRHLSDDGFRCEAFPVDALSQLNLFCEEHDYDNNVIAVGDVQPLDPI